MLKCNLEHEGDIEKDVPVTEPEVVTEKEIKEASLYTHELYTVIPKEHDIHFGILPEDQRFSSKYVFLWDTYSQLTRFGAEFWNRVRIEIPQDIRFTELRKLGGGILAIPKIPNTWKIEVIKKTPLYEE